MERNPAHHPPYYGHRYALGILANRSRIAQGLLAEMSERVVGLDHKTAR
jgi:hypothetical protein